MTPQEISQVYQELESLEVRLAHVPELGQHYLTDRMVECREKQNRITELFVKTNQAYSAALRAKRAQEKALQQAATSEQSARLRQDLSDLLDEYDSTKLLLEAIRVRRQNLARTSIDIRALSQIVTEQRRLGSVVGGKDKPEDPTTPEPPEAPGPVLTADLPENAVVENVVIEPPSAAQQPLMDVQLAEDEDDIERFLNT